MTQSLILPAAGLMTDPGPFTAAPEGGMLEAQNVIILRPGVIEPRPGLFCTVDETIKAATGTYGIQIYADVLGATWVWTNGGLIRKNASTTITGPSSFSSGKTMPCATGGRVLFTTNNGVCTLPLQLASPASGSATVAYRAGMPQPYTAAAYTTSTIGAWLPTNYAVAYRFTLRRRLANGAIIESAPSNRMVARNATGFARSPSLGNASAGAQGWITAQLATNDFGDLIAGDELCIYRAALSVTPSTAEPSDEMQLRAVLAYTPASDAFVDPQTGGVWVDLAPDGGWSGSALYTNTTQEGALLGNYRPEYARDIALYRGMTFYAGAKSSQRVDITLGAVGDLVIPQNSLTTRVFGATVGITLGSPTITGIAAADMAFLAVGQVVASSAGTPISAPNAFATGAQIISLTATTATMDSNALFTNAAVNLTAWDWVQVTDGTYTLRTYAQPAGASFGDTNNVSFDQTVGSQDIEFTWATNAGGMATRWREFQLRVSYDAAESQTRKLTWSFFRTDPSEASFTVTSSKPYAWDRYVDSVTGVTSAQTGGDAELRWSKVNEPEHCPLPYRTTVGSAAHSIRRILALKNSLLIFKDDGLFQCFGSTPTDLQFEQLDSTIIIPGFVTSDEQSKWVARFDDRAFAMTTRGPMMITDAGAQPIGAPILESLRRTVGNGFGAYDTLDRAMMVDVQSRRVAFFVVAPGGGEVSGPACAWVLDPDAGTWTYWLMRRGVTAASVRQDTALPIVATEYMYGFFSADRSSLDDATLPSGTRLSSDTVSTQLGPASTCTISAVTGTGPYDITIAAGSEWVPTVGDVLVRSGATHVVVAVTDTEHFQTESQPTTGSATWKESFECRCVWLARAEGNPGTEKHRYDVVFPFELGAVLNRMKSYFKGYRNTGTAIEAFIDASQTVGAAPWSLVPSFKRASVPTAVARDWAHQVGFSIRQAGAWFSTAGVSLVHDQIAAPNKAAR